MLKPGDHVTGRRVGRLSVVETLGEGGQGWVYRVSSVNDGDFALKWYKSVAAVPEQWTTLEFLLDRGAPDPRFLWPVDLVGSVDEASFGYVMPLRPPEYLGFASLVLNHRSSQDVSHLTVIELCRQLAETFLKLHAQGMCYRDINFGNVFFRPDSGDVLICDVDNVGIDDGVCRILGTVLFMAPEIVQFLGEPSRENSVMPSRLTDLHSLAVLLFYALMNEHPLEGVRTDSGLRNDDFMRKHFGVHPLFNLHDTDSRNQPTQRYVRDCWIKFYPEFLRKLFRTAFIDGLTRPAARVTEGQWVKWLTRMREITGQCPYCRETVFFDPEATDQRCSTCERVLPEPTVLRVAGREIVVAPDMLVWTGRGAPGERASPVGRGVAHPADSARIGLANVSRESWRARYPDGSEQVVRPGQGALLIEGLELTMQGAVARVVKRSAADDTKTSDRHDVRRPR
jgi:serine/threonine protein kinase